MIDLETTVFDQILTGAIPSYKLYEDDTVYAFLDISQITPGHTLVIPKKPSLSLLETDEATAQAVFNITTKLAKKIVTALGATGCNILTNAHESAGQEVMYFHVHIIPRFVDDTGIDIVFASSSPSTEQLTTIQKQILQAESF